MQIKYSTNIIYIINKIFKKKKKINPLSTTFKGKEVLNMEDELINAANKDIPMANNNIQDDAILNAYREALKHNDPFLTTMDFRDLMQEMNLEL